MLEKSKAYIKLKEDYEQLFNNILKWVPITDNTNRIMYDIQKQIEDLPWRYYKEKFEKEKKCHHPYIKKEKEFSHYHDYMVETCQICGELINKYPLK